MANKCYLVITPDPSRGFIQPNTPGQKPYFHIKFGDGDFRSSYDVHNPNFASKENAHSTHATLETQDKNGRPIQRKIGKWLEWTYIKQGGVDDFNYNFTEWYKVTPKAATMTGQQLGHELLGLLPIFENYNWNTAHQQPLDVQFTRVHGLCDFVQYGA